MSTNAHAVREVYAAYNRGDVRAALAILAPDVDWRVAPGIPGERAVYAGREAVVEFFHLIDEAFESHHLDLESVTDVGEHVAVVGRHRWVPRGGGAPVETRFIHTWSFRDGRAVAMHELVDSSRVPGPAAGGRP